jgi:hypothetical protein
LEESGRASHDAHRTTPTSKGGSLGTPVSDDKTAAKMGYPVRWIDFAGVDGSEWMSCADAGAGVRGDDFGELAE